MILLDTAPTTEWVAAALSAAVALGGGLLAAREGLRSAAKAVATSREIDRVERAEYVAMVGQAATATQVEPRQAASILDRFRDRSERREAMLEKEIRDNLRIRNVYQWVFLACFAFGVVPLVLGIWFIVLGLVPAGAITTAAGVFLEVTGVFSNQTAGRADRNAERRIAELQRSQDKNDGYEAALYAAGLIIDPEARAEVLRTLAFAQIGFNPAGGKELQGPSSPTDSTEAP